MTIVINPIALLSSPLKEKFGTPRQPNLVPVISTITMLSPYDIPAAFDGLEQFSHIWLLWNFHANRASSEHSFRPQIRPPRLGGNAKIGVFASRSMYRPNPIGLSVVKLLHISQTTPVVLTVEGADLIDGTPIIDIKPYINYSDSIADANSGYAQLAPASDIAIIWQHNALADLQQCIGQQLLTDADQAIIEQLLQQNPRPAYQAAEGCYGMRYAQVNVAFSYVNATADTSTDGSNSHSAPTILLNRITPFVD